jgi:hypothetical protein
MSVSVFSTKKSATMELDLRFEFPMAGFSLFFSFRRLIMHHPGIPGILEESDRLRIYTSLFATII